MTDTITAPETDTRVSFDTALSYYTAETFGKPIYCAPSYESHRDSFFYRCGTWDNNPLAQIRTSYPERFLAVLDEAYVINDKWAGITPLTSESDAQAAERQAQALNASAEQRTKLRELVEARRNAELMVTNLRTQLAESQAQLVMANETIVSAEDSRLVPIWLQAARAASMANHCEEYDRLAGDIGAPGRDDLRKMGYSVSDGARLEINVSFTVTVEVDNYDNWQDEYYEELAFEMITDNLTYSDGSYNVTNADRVELD